MKPHVKPICKAAYFVLHNINSVRRSLTKEAAATAIHAFVTSRLDVCNSPLYGLPKVTLSQVQWVQNSAANCLVVAKWWEHITPVLRDLHWLSISRHVDYKILVLVYKALNGTAPEYMCELLTVLEGVWDLRSVLNVVCLKKPRTKPVTGGDRSFEKAAACLWNCTPVPLNNRLTRKFYIWS